MLDSTARAERIDLPSSEARLLHLGSGAKAGRGAPAAAVDRPPGVRGGGDFSLAQLARFGDWRIAARIVRAGQPGAGHGTDFELIPCDYSRGPLYRLSDADLGRFEQAMEKHASGNGPRVVGYFRSHTRKGLSLDAEDLAFFEPRFLDPQHIVLVIRPFATKASTAGIFIRENGKIGRGSQLSRVPIPFLGACAEPRREAEKPAGRFGAGRRKPLAQPASPPKPQSRAQIVPIASRREIALPEPVASAPALRPLWWSGLCQSGLCRAHRNARTVSSKVEAQQVQAQPAVPVVEKDDKEKPKEKVAEKAAEKPVEKAVEKAVEKPVEKVIAQPPSPWTAAEALAPAAETVEIALPVPVKKNKKLRLLVAAAIGMLVLGGGGLVVYPTLMKRLAPPAPAAPQDSSPLSLRVERTSGGMLLTWNRDLPVIQGATQSGAVDFRRRPSRKYSAGSQSGSHRQHFVSADDAGRKLPDGSDRSAPVEDHQRIASRIGSAALSAG